MDLFFGLKQFFLGSLVGAETFVWPLHKQNSDHSLPKIEVSWCQQSFQIKFSDFSAPKLVFTILNNISQINFDFISQHWPDFTIWTKFHKIDQIWTWIFLLTFPAVWICISQSHTTTGACDVSVQDGANRGQLDEENGDIKLFSCFFSSVRSSNSHPDLLLTQQHHHPLFQITPVLNTGLSLSEPLQLYKGYNAI